MPMSRTAFDAHKSQSIVLFSVIFDVVSRRVSGSHLESRETGHGMRGKAQCVRRGTGSEQSRRNSGCAATGPLGALWREQ